MDYKAKKMKAMEPKPHLTASPEDIANNEIIGLQMKIQELKAAKLLLQVRRMGHFGNITALADSFEAEAKEHNAATKNGKVTYGGPVPYDQE